MKYLSEEELSKLNDYQRNRYINYVKKHLSHNTKLNIVKQATSSEEGMKGLLVQVYKACSNKIISFFRNHKTDYCYVHFTFVYSQATPIILIDQDPNSHPDMYCIKYSKFL